MSRTSAPPEPTVERRVFEAWSIEIPAAFDETFIREDDYWHGYDEHRSVSLSSIVLDFQGVPASAAPDPERSRDTGWVAGHPDAARPARNCCNLCRGPTRAGESGPVRHACDARAPADRDHHQR